MRSTTRKSPRLAIKNTFNKFVNTASDPIDVGDFEDNVGVSEALVTVSPHTDRAVDDIVMDYKTKVILEAKACFEKIRERMKRDADKKMEATLTDDAKEEKLKRRVKSKTFKKQTQNRKNVNNVDRDTASQEKSEMKKRKRVVKPLTWFGIRTRSCPLQLFNAIKKMTKKQREIVRSIGFGKILRLKVDGIPAKLAHFVISMLDTKKMVIKLGEKSIKVDKESIHKLIGIPMGSINLVSVQDFVIADPIVTEWKDRYPKLFTSSNIAKKIIENKYESDYIFKLDFITMFCTTMIECTSNGKCLFPFMDNMKMETDFREYDWCGYVIECIRRCKLRWKARDMSSYFCGPLAILVLLYVDSVICPGLYEERTMPAISFWTMEKLREREAEEIKFGGFGLGDMREIFADDVNYDLEINDEAASKVIDSDAEDNNYNCQDISGQLLRLDALYVRNLKYKMLLEKELLVANERFASSAEVKVYIDRYKELFGKSVGIEDDITEQQTDEVQAEAGETPGVWTQAVIDVMDEVVRTPAVETHEQHTGQSVGAISWTQEWIEATDRAEKKSAERQKLEERRKRIASGGPYMETYRMGVVSGGNIADAVMGVDTSKEVPNFSLGLTQDFNYLDKGKKKQDQSSRHSGATIEKEVTERPALRKGKRLKTVSVHNCSPYMSREVDINKELSKDEKKIWDFISDVSEEMGDANAGVNEKYSVGSGKEMYVMDRESKEKMEVAADNHGKIFSTAYGVSTWTYILRSLTPGNQLYSSVIDCWAAVLNHEEKYRSPSSKHRLFCYASIFTENVLYPKCSNDKMRFEEFKNNLTSVLEGRDELLDLKTFDILLFPILDKGHLFLVCFDLKNPSIKVIDNAKDKGIRVGVRNSMYFSDMDAPMKVKYVVVNYLQLINHMKWRDISMVDPEVLDIPWATTKNYVDCGVFLMRHMEMFKGEYDQVWDCGFPANERSKKAKINLLRKRYATRMLLSDANVNREKVMREVLGR